MQRIAGGTLRKQFRARSKHVSLPQDLYYGLSLGKKQVKKYVNIPSEKYIYVHIYVCKCVYTYLCKMDEYWSYAGWS